MIISQSYYFKHLIAESKNSAEAKQCLEQYIATSNIDNSYIINAYKSGKLDIKVIDFYKFIREGVGLQGLGSDEKFLRFC